ncbi:MAG TPA: NAD(P)-dependent oxidoreductase [Burkholderiales bacterium]|nr:NAD(P)-dependent oxidoreductase [Burkholderiales bacterium]
MHLGFIGIGKMGAPMAGRLLDAGYTLTLFDTREAALQPLLKRGARQAASVAALAAEVETVLVSLPTPDIVKQVALGAEGVASGSKRRLRDFVDLSTTGPRVAREIAAGLAAKGITAVDSPVSGGVSGAEKGTLAVMFACPQERRALLEPVLKVFGKLFYLGDKPGLGQTMKLANNLLSATAMAISSEAIVMGVKAGLDPRVMVDVINAGSGRNSATQDKFPRAILPRSFDFGFTNTLMHKDVKLCVEEAEAMGVPMWVGSAVRQLWSYTCTRMGPETDFTTIVRCIEEWAGVEVKEQAKARD